MNTKQAYDIWSEQYDTAPNKTRDLEAYALRTVLANISFDTCLEIGCGTGKNTEWLTTKAKRITAIDLSDEMLAKAKEKVISEKVKFLQADINQNWTFISDTFELVSFSLVLEHIENLDSIFRKTSKVLISSGYIYIGELHPFKQYSGTKANFTNENGQHVLDCYNHNISDYIQSAKRSGIEIVDIGEYFDENDRTTIPRILALLMKKKR